MLMLGNFVIDKYIKMHHILFHKSAGNKKDYYPIFMIKCGGWKILAEMALPIRNCAKKILKQLMIS
jgi:hypothetical protein